MSANYELYEKVRRETAMCEAQKETTITLSQMGMSVENIAKAVNADIEQVRGWIDGQ